MKITKLILENFKGIFNRRELEIKPITVIIGANSSGKSSIIHSLAALSQSLKIPNNQKPFIFDDDQAYVHLGRFIDAIHSKDYKDSIVIGIKFSEIEVTVLELKEDNDEKNKDKNKNSYTPIRYKGDLDIEIKIKSTKKTQEIFLDNATYKLGNLTYEIMKSANGYTIASNKVKKTFPCKLTEAFLVDNFDLNIQLRKNNVDFSVFFAFNTIQNQVKEAILKILYLGPFRQPPSRKYSTRGSSPIEVGSMGESSVTLIANEFIQKRSREHIEEISKWLTTMGLAKKIDPSRVPGSDLFEVTIQLNDDEKFNIADLGYGFSQIIPVLAQCSFSKSESILLFEQPELHLHPLACGALAKIFIDTVKRKKSVVLLETHSEQLIYGFIRAIRDGELSATDFSFYKIDREGNETIPKKIEIIDADGSIDIYDNWKKHFSE